MRHEAVRFALVALALAAVALLVRGLGLTSEPLLSDDLGCGVSAVNFVERGQIGPTMWQHPRLRDLAVYASMLALGPTKLGFALPSLLLGVLAVPALALLGRRIGGARVGLVAAALLAVDALHVGMSRQAVAEVFTTFFAITGALLALEFDRTRRLAPLFAAGIVFGLGAAAKWSVVGAAFAAAVWLGWRELRQAGGRREVAARTAVLVAALVVVPATVYLLTWTPWFLHGRDLFDFVRLHRAMAAEAATHQGFTRAEVLLPHRAIAWFTVPTGYASFAAGPQGPVPYVFVTNPIVWLLVLPAAALVARAAWRERRAHDALLLALFAATYLPFAAVGRPIWLHSALAPEPFALLLVATLVVRASSRVTRPGLALAAYLVATIAISIPLDLLATGRGWESPALRGIAARFRPPPEMEENAAEPR